MILSSFLAAFGFDDAVYIIMALATAASTYASYSASQSASKRAAQQAELNANAEAQAAEQAAEEKAAEARAKMMEQRRFRQTQIAAMSGQGIQLTGTPLDILADTEVQNQLELSNIAYSGDVQQRDLEHMRKTALASGQAKAGAALASGPNAAATILSGASQLADVYGDYQYSQSRKAPAART